MTLERLYTVLTESLRNTITLLHRNAIETPYKLFITAKYELMRMNTVLLHFTVFDARTNLSCQFKYLINFEDLFFTFENKRAECNVRIQPAPVCS